MRRVLTVLHSSPNRARYFRSRSASFGAALRPRDTLKSRRPASESEVRGGRRRAAPRRAGPDRTDRVACAPPARAPARRAPCDRVAAAGGAPAVSQPLDLLGDDLLGDASAGRERGHPGDGGAEVPEVAGPDRIRRGRERDEALACLTAHRDEARPAGGRFAKLVIEVGLDVFGPLAQARQLERPQVDAGQQVVAEAPAPDRRRRDRRWCRRSAGSRCGPRDRSRAAGTVFSSIARSSAACSSGPSSPISSRKSTPPSAVRSRPARSRSAPVNAPRTWPNSADIAASPRTVAQLTSTNGPVTRCRNFFRS